MAPSKTAVAETILSDYIPPHHGVFSILPVSWAPYAELMRLDRPAGFYAFYWHYAIGIAFAACLSNPPPPLSFILVTALYYVFGVIVLRGVTCTWNDNLDQEFDRKVARCRNRPIARGAVSTAQGHVFTAAQAVLGMLMLRPLPAECTPHVAIIVAVLGVYPLAKRVTNFPQVVLGFGLSHPIFLCCATFGLDPLNEAIFWPAFSLYVAGSLWTIIFDTIYAHQDIEDDKKAGVMSLAVLLGDKTKLGVSAMAVVQVMALCVCGWYAGFSLLYFASSCLGAAIALTSMIWMVDLKSPASCAWWFGPGSRLVGGSVVMGLAAEYYMKTFVW